VPGRTCIRKVRAPKQRELGIGAADHGDVGGDILDAARLAMRGRVVLCGGIANYNAIEPPPGPKNYVNLIVQRGRMEGIIVLDYMPRAAEAIGALAGWVREGKLKNKVDAQHGLENAPETLRRLFEGRNEGKHTRLDFS
jgi:NADPH-dependent curcumin reductase